MNIGDFVRTEYGIKKIEKIIENTIQEDELGREWETNKRSIRYIDNDGWNKGMLEEDIIKSSPNIIDLVKVGDYVNGIKMIEVKGQLGFYDTDMGEEYFYILKDLQIFSIVTHEQFEAMEYEVNNERNKV